MSASTRAIGLGVALLGTTLGGVAGEVVGIEATVLIGATGGLFAWLWLVFSPVQTLRSLPNATSTE